MEPTVSVGFSMSCLRASCGQLHIQVATGRLTQPEFSPTSFLSSPRIMTAHDTPKPYPWLFRALYITEVLWVQDLSLGVPNQYMVGWRTENRDNVYIYMCIYIYMAVIDCRCFCGCPDYNGYSVLGYQERVACQTWTDALS